jgi:flavorubredoxin
MVGFARSAAPLKASLRKQNKETPENETERICSGDFSVGAVDWDRRLFDALVPLPDGTSYNAYLVKGSEKTALIDSVDRKMPEILIE